VAENKAQRKKFGKFALGCFVSLSFCEVLLFLITAVSTVKLKEFRLFIAGLDRLK